MSWGGDPTKPVAADSGERLRPRHSFALWREEVRLRSHPWTASDLEAADELQRRAIEVDLERRLLSEQRAVRARDDLIAVVSHDLRSPLSTILMQAEVMLSQAPAGGEEPLHALRGCAERIRRSATHMKALIDDLLDLARIEAQRFALHLQSVESRDLVEEALLAASPLAEAKRITLAVELDRFTEAGSRPRADLPGALEPARQRDQVHPRRRARSPSARSAAATSLLITVADTGPGIAADQLPHVFDRYWKARPASQAGAGLGLYIAKGIVEAHGGRIWAESSSDGARFTFTLPIARSV